MAFTRLLLFKHWFINAYKHLAVNEDRQKKSKAVTYNLRGDDIILHCKPFSSGFKNYQKRFTNPILFPHYRIATLVLPSESRAIDFLKLFGIVIYLRSKKKNHFSVHIILCLKLCYNSEKIKSFVNYRYSPFREWLFLFLRAITLHTVKRVL